MKKKSLKTTCSKNWKKLISFLRLQIYTNPKKKSFRPIGCPDARKTIGQSE